MKKLFCAFVILIFLIFMALPVYSEGKKVTINSAQYTEYKKIPSMPDSGNKDAEDIPKDEVIIFTGTVSISVSDDSSTSTIKADKIIHNKTRDTLAAFGNVVYERHAGSASGESFKGEYLLFNIKKLEGIFLDGIIEQAPTKKGKEPFRIHTGIAGKNESGVIAFKDALLTTSKDDDPLWSIRASRIWILPGNEMAFANGFLSVGIVPVLYLPFFYYPSDEMLFHPVFGFKNIQGAFVQTTTYLLGRKPLPKAEEVSSFSNFMQSDTLKKQKLEGLFFKKLDETEDKVADSYLKFLADKYSALGFMLGLDGKFYPPTEYIKQIAFHTLFGVSNTVYTENKKTSSKYDKNGKVNKNSSTLLGLKVPFRYDINFAMDIIKDPLKFSLSMPLMSDPYFKKDFLARSEDMNWFKYLLDKDKLAAIEGPAVVSNFLWKVDGSISPVFKIVQPFINSISVESITGSFNFENKKNEQLSGQESLYSPERNFFYPKNLVPELRARMSGTLFSTSMLQKKNTQSVKIDLEGIKNPFDENFAQTLKNEIENKNSDSSDTESSREDINEKSANEFDGQNDEDNKTKEDKALEEKIKPLKIIFPQFHISQEQTNKTSHSINYDLTYKLNGLAQEDITFDYKSWKSPADINLKSFYSNYYKLNGLVSFDSKFSYNHGLLNINNSFELQGNYQKHPWHKDKDKLEETELINYKLSVYSLKNSNSIKCSPLIFHPIFKPIYLEWAMSEILLQSKFTGTYKKPVWAQEKIKWEKEFITKHSAAVGMGFILYDYTQLITSTINLPPLLQAYSFSGSFKLPYTSLNLSTKLFEKKAKSAEEMHKLKKWNWEPFKAEVKFSFPFNISLSQSYIYNIADKTHDTYSLSFGWKYINASYNMAREIPYKYDTVKGWIPKSTEKKFIPQSLNFNFSNSSSPIEFYLWRNRIKFQFTFSSSLNFNLNRVTDSYFTFSPKITFKIHEFLDFSFTSNSRNDSIAKYFQDIINFPILIPGEKNILKDLALSFYFWDDNARRMSAFKLKSLDFELTHYLKDWIMKFSYSVKPILKTEGARKLYKLTPTITFAVQWNPIGDIKVQAKQEENKFTVNRGEIK